MLYEKLNTCLNLTVVAFQSTIIHITVNAIGSS